MKKQTPYFTLFAMVFFLMIGALETTAQKLPGLDASPTDISYFRPNGRGTAPLAKVTYGRPSKKGRTMLGGTEAFGKVWRLGANVTTEIKLYQDITFGDKLIKAGTYSVFAIPDKTEWTIIFNSKLDTWGAFEYDQSKDVARVKVPAGNSESEVEAFTMIFDGKDATASLVIAWENTLVKVPLKY
ncbi:MAG TPA: DUF2911 domain-containing protein [Cyclobacteriaceae bacterium]|nr:DUF2911 domain-containing protein [Cyclobacteriaceae bacterium]